ncbi:MAG: hypothetical protein ISS44_05130, partial [Candidatus Omnitrophica bacterium]|nr:hypothetical protein [Candidatus Omnitrophota bacterium]
MRRCKICKVPLGGVLSVIGRLFLKIRPSGQNPEICNKCANAQLRAEEQKKTEPRQYKCQICGRMIHEEHALMHAKAEEYLMNLIKKDHPQWQQK